MVRLLFLFLLLLFEIALASRSSFLTTFRVEDFKLNLDSKKVHHDSIVSEAIYLIKRHFIRRHMYDERVWADWKTELNGYEDKRWAMQVLMERLQDPYSCFIAPNPMRAKQQHIRGTSIGVGLHLKRSFCMNELVFGVKSVLRLYMPVWQMPSKEFFTRLRSTSSTTSTTSTSSLAATAESTLTPTPTTRSSLSQRITRGLCRLFMRNKASPQEEQSTIKRYTIKDQHYWIKDLCNLTKHAAHARPVAAHRFIAMKQSLLLRYSYFLSLAAAIQFRNHMSLQMQQYVCAAYLVNAVVTLSKELFPIVCPIVVADVVDQELLDSGIQVGDRIIGKK